MRAMTLRSVVVLALLMVAGFAPGRPSGAAMVAVGTLTVTSSTSVTAGITTYTLAWTSSAGGAVSGNPFTVKRGYLVSAKAIPAAGGSAPTALYDITLVDTDSVDLLNGLAADQSATLGQYFLFDPPFYQDGTQQLDLVIANAGNAKSGTVKLWVRTQ